MVVDAKDFWEKLEIYSKFIGAAIIPVVVAASVFVWNDLRKKREVPVLTFGVAVDVLGMRPILGSDGNDALRKWATEVLNNPMSAPGLGE